MNDNFLSDVKDTIIGLLLLFFIGWLIITICPILFKYVIIPLLCLCLLIWLAPMVFDFVLCALGSFIIHLPLNLLLCFIFALVLSLFKGCS